MIDLFLIRHGIAAEPHEYATDSERPLTAEGIQKTRRVAERLKALDLEFDLIQTSPLVRAKQTAEILFETKLSKTVEISDYLAPSGNIQSWANWFQEWRKQGGTAIALVGHEPNLGQWAEWFCWGEYRDRLIVKKAGVIGVKVPPDGDLQGQCQLFWLAPPKLLL
jgi:phosphohistidine phosphatase